MKRLVILGSTGSIGTQTLEVICAYPDEFQIIGLSAHANAKLFEKQVREFQPKYAVLTSMSENQTQALQMLATVSDADLIVNALAGTSGLMPTYAACKAGKKIALANKESLVMAGELITNLARQTGAQILPIDSEPSAVWQCLSSRGGWRPKKQSSLDCFLLAGGHGADVRDDIAKIILTASGGPFWKWRREELEKVTFKQALKHPTWKMGEKVSIDSATLMNKAFEIIETRWFFDIPPEKIDVTIHRQSIAHAFVQFCDGNTQAVLSPPDMRIPIASALFYPARTPLRPSSGGPAFSSLDFSQLALTFEKPDFSIFEGPKLAYEVLRAGGIMPAAFCLADEIAVSQFSRGAISFLGIYDFIKRALETIKNTTFSFEALSNLTQSVNSLTR